MTITKQQLIDLAKSSNATVEFLVHVEMSDGCISFRREKRSNGEWEYSLERHYESPGWNKRHWFDAPCRFEDLHLLSELNVLDLEFSVVPRRFLGKTVDTRADHHLPLRIVRAAIKDDRGAIWSVPAPGRHHDVINLMRKSGYEGPVGGDHQGFLTSEGGFVRRAPAKKIAEKANQIKAGKTISATLTSEDLW